MPTEENVDNKNAAFNNTNPRSPSKTSLKLMQSTKDDSMIMKLFKDMGKLLTVLGDVNQEDSCCTIHWRRERIIEPAVTAEAELYI